MGDSYLIKDQEGVMWIGILSYKLRIVCAGWVENAEEYLYSSVRNYAGLVGQLDIEMIWKRRYNLRLVGV